MSLVQARLAMGVVLSVLIAGCGAYARRAGRCFTTVGRWPERIELISLSTERTMASGPKAG